MGCSPSLAIPPANQIGLCNPSRGKRLIQRDPANQISAASISVPAAKIRPAPIGQRRDALWPCIRGTTCSLTGFLAFPHRTSRHPRLSMWWHEQCRPHIFQTSSPPDVGHVYEGEGEAEVKATLVPAHRIAATRPFSLPTPMLRCRG